jgi:hypothetical protein
VGRKVEVSMLEATLALAVEPLAHYFVTGDEQPFYPAWRDVAGLYPHLQGRQAHRPADVIAGQVLERPRRGHRVA